MSREHKEEGNQVDDLQRLHIFLAAGEKEKKKLLKDDEYIPGVVTITGNLYPKSQEIHDILLEYLDAEGYKVKDCTIPEPGHEKYFNRPSPEVQKQEGWYTGFASLKEDVLQHVAKCGSCEAYISRTGIMTNGHTCESCGDITYDKFPKGSQVRFSYFFEPENEIRGVSFRSDGDDAKEAVIDPKSLINGSLVVESYDPETQELYCYANPSELEKEGLDFGSAVENTCRKLAEDDDHIDRIIVKATDISEVRGSKHNYIEVKLFRGQEFDEFMDKLPIPDLFSIYQPWHWMPAEPSPTLHEKIIGSAGMASDKGYYYQDGRAAFYDIHLDRMRRFVRNFTTLDLKRWDGMIRNAKKSGPGMIDAISHFCSENPVVSNAPNVWNAIIGMVPDKHKTRDQLEAEVNYLKTEGFDGDMDELIDKMEELGMIPDLKEVDRDAEDKKWIQDIWDSLNIEDED